MKVRRYDLEDRLLAFSAAVIRLVEQLPSTRTGNHLAGQLLRSGTSPPSNHGEAQAAESPADFVHKLRVCLKELRETKRWLRLVDMTGMLDGAGLTRCLNETEELIRIVVTSIQTAERRRDLPGVTADP